MTITDKLVADAVYAVEVRDLAPRGTAVELIVRAALDAFEATLSRCGCDDCSNARRENNGLSEHDRTTLARALHEIVYSPGATYDRAVPGIQQHVLACADKVAAALPWIVPTPEVEGEPSDAQVDAVAKAIAEAAIADYWTDEIAEWEGSEEWEREAYPDNHPHTAYEDREEFRKQARAALRAAGGVR